MDPPVADPASGSSGMPSAPNSPKKRAKRKAGGEPPRFEVTQMDALIAFNTLKKIKGDEDAHLSTFEKTDLIETLRRLTNYRHHKKIPTIAEAVKQIVDAGSCPYARIRKEVEKRRMSAFKSSLTGRLVKRLEIKKRIDEVKREMAEKAALSSDDERTKLWRAICRKQIHKAAKQMSSSYGAKLSNARRTAGFCVRETKKLWTRQGRLAKESTQRGRKQMREMLLFWKKNEREERESRKRAEKEAAEQRRLEEEQREARRQAKKLNFLLTQTELFSHFVASKSGSGETVPAPATAVLKAGVDLADVDDETLKQHAEQVARSAAEKTRARRDEFNDGTGADLDFSKANVEQTVLQPRMLQATLKEYQLLGLSWMANLYEQGINGILADEMGLGKTIQAISLLAHLAETHNIWGPFLVVAPASTLHNWQQELTRFLPSFKILPYWGNVNDRKSLRKFWPSSSKRPFKRDSTFHVMVTSYQLVISDQAFLQKIRWQYMVLDEAQAIKSSASQRWNVLLGFPCRNRLLLTGTPIQNTMQELWALLHFIMPSLFDSHDEFSDWFSKDIESKAAAESGEKARSGGGMANFDQHQLARLHMILKPFMLRRIKKDVQSELAPKVELEIPCEMTPKQKRLYKALKQRLPMAELLKTMAGPDESEASATLMNIVMQCRKVCNHPELFERAAIQSPFVFCHSPPAAESVPIDKNRLAWPGPYRSLLDGCGAANIDLDRYIPIRVGAVTDIPIATKEAVEPFEDFVPVSIRFFNERWPRTFIPAAVAPSVIGTNDPSLALEDSYSTGQQIVLPDARHIISDCGKMARLDALLTDLKEGGHRVLLYNQMTRMIDLMEEYLQYKKWRYLRLDGSTKIADRRDMVNDWQGIPDIFVFLLSTRAGGLGINLTAADTVIFYDSDWNPTVDQQAMDRAHRLGQQKQVTVYRLVTAGSIEERIQQRAHQKDLVQKVVIAGGDYGGEVGAGGATSQPVQWRAKDVASLLLDEDDFLTK